MVPILFALLFFEHSYTGTSNEPGGGHVVVPTRLCNTKSSAWANDETVSPPYKIHGTFL